MTTSCSTPRTFVSARTNNEIGDLSGLLADELVATKRCAEKPTTAWEFAVSLGDRSPERASAILSRLNVEGTLARFKAGFNHYYGSPKMVLTTAPLALDKIISDSLKGLFLNCRYKAMEKLKGKQTVVPERNTRGTEEFANGENESSDCRC